MNRVGAVANGQLGFAASSARFKGDIRDMGTASDALMKLRPVTFRYRDDPDEDREYGLVAEEVAKVYPELAVYDTDGSIETVRYSVLSPMLLNELQKQIRKNDRQTQQINVLSARLARLRADQERQRLDFEAQLAALERTLTSADPGYQLTAVPGR